MRRTGFVLSFFPFLGFLLLFAFLISQGARSGIFLLYFFPVTVLPLAAFYFIYLLVRWWRFDRQSPLYLTVQAVSLINLILLFPLCLTVVGTLLLPIAELVLLYQAKKERSRTS